MASSSSGAGNSSPGASAPSVGEEAGFSQFMTEVKAIEERDSVLTPQQQIDRLLRPGSTYFNLNPFEVLQVDPEIPLDQIKKHYRKMSILIHPDKNPDNRDRAQQAFEILSKAMKNLNDDKERQAALDMIKEAKEKTEFELTEQRKQLKKDGKELEEDVNPQKYKERLYKTTVKLFADYELRRRALMERDAKERKREREEEIAQEEKVKKKKEWEKDWEQRRDERVTSWRDFSQATTKKKKSKNRMTFKPPKPKLEKSGK